MSVLMVPYGFRLYFEVSVALTVSTYSVIWPLGGFSQHIHQWELLHDKRLFNRYFSLKALKNSVILKQINISTYTVYLFHDRKDNCIYSLTNILALWCTSAHVYLWTVDVISVFCQISSCLVAKTMEVWQHFWWMLHHEVHLRHWAINCILIAQIIQNCECVCACVWLL